MKNRGRRGTFSDPERPPEGATGGKSTPPMECYPEPTGIPGRPSGQMPETFVRREEKRTGYGVHQIPPGYRDHSLDKRVSVKQIRGCRSGGLLSTGR